MADGYDPLEDVLWFEYTHETKAGNVVVRAGIQAGSLMGVQALCQPGMFLSPSILAGIPLEKYVTKAKAQAKDES